MDATQQIEDSFFREEDDSDGEDEKGEGKTQREPLAVLKVFKNNHIPETEVPLYQGENVLGRDPSSCSVPLQARSISGCHAIISISVFGPNDRRAHNEATEALLWDLGSLNGTRKGRLKLTPHVRYALTDRDSVVLADLPCQYVNLKNTERDTNTSGADCEKEKVMGSGSTSSSSDGETGKGVENGGKKSALPPVPVWSDEGKSLEALQISPRRPEMTLVPESDSDSDGENGRRERKRIVVSESASSDLSSPMCSTFLTPANKIIPESEDESSITPSPALKGSFLKTGNDTNVSSDSSKPDPLHFNIDSDTDVEDEEVDQTKATSGIEAAVTAEVNAVNPADLHMDSDTDVEDEEVDKAQGDREPLEAPAKQDPVNPSTLIMDSDTDAEENGPEAAVEEKKEPTSSAQFNMESDTDVEDEDVPHNQDSRPSTSHVGELNIDSDTDVEEDEEAKKAIQTPSGSRMITSDQVKQTSLEVPDDKTVHHQSDSDTDAEDDERSTGAKLDEPVEVRPPAETVRDEFRLDSDTDVEEEDEKIEENEGKCAEAAGQIVHSSTPRGAGLSEEEMETQVFLSPSQPFKRPGLPSLLHPSISPGGVSHSDDDFAVAETQSFVCDAAQADATLDETPQSLDDPESRQMDGASSFQLGLSDSSHKLPETEEHDREPAEEDWQLQETQLYAMKHSEGSTKAGQTQPDLDATQAYVDFIGREEEEDEDEEEEEKVEEEEKTQPLAALGHSNIQTVETQLIKHEAQDKENGDHGANEEAVASEPKRKAGEDVDEEMQADSHLSTADTLLIIRSPRQEDQPRPYAFLSAENLKEQEEAASEGEKAQDEHVKPENDDDEGRERKKNDLTRDEPKEEKKESDKDEGVERGNETAEAGTPPAETDTIVETQPMCEEDEACEEEQLNEPSSSRGTPPAKVESTQPLVSDVHTHVGIPETQPMCEEEEGQEEKEQKPRNSTRPAGRRRTAKAEPESDNVTHVTVAETQPMCEEDQAHEEEQLNEPSSSKGTPPAKVESTQPLESDVHTPVGIPETQPMCEEEEGQEEEEQKPRNSTRPGRRRRTAKAEPKSDNAESDNVTHVSVAETQPMCEEDNEVQGEEQQSEVVSTKRSSTRRHVAKTKLVESYVAIPETLPMCEEEEGQNESKPGRKSRRGRQTVKTEPTQPLESDSAVEEEEEEQDSRRSLRGKKEGRATSGKGKGKGRAAAARGRRGQVEQEEDSEEEADQGRKGRGQKNLRQAPKEELVEAENEGAEQLGKQEEEEERTRLQREKEEEEARDQLEREESMRLEKKEKEEHEKREQEEKDRIEREEKEMKEREKQLEKERIERETREKEEKDKLEKEKLEKERQKQEEIDRLAKEKRDREEKERLEKEMREEKKRQEKEMEQKKNEEESKDNKEGVDKEKRQAPGKRKTGPGRRGGNSKKEEEQELEKGTKESLESEIPQLECEEGSSKKQEDDQAESEAKPRRGRRTTRKSTAPPADIEDEGGPAKRTRSRSNSSNSVCSERSTQDSLTEGRRRGGRRKTTEETNEPARTSGRSKTFAAPSSEKEDIKQPAQSRSNSRSSDRSSSTTATQRQGRGEKRRKGMIAEESEEAGEKEEEVEQSAAVGRGRGRKGRKSIKVEEPEVAEEEEKVEQSAAVGRGRGRGRKSIKLEEPEIAEEVVEQLASVGRGRGGKGRKSIKVEEPEVAEEKEEEVEQSPAVGRGRGRGRGRGGKRPEATAIKAEATGEAEKEETEVMSVSEDSVSSQSSSRGRKRGADVSVLAAEAPQPTPKTPRRSLGGQTHKVLFTGVMDEDGEKVVVRLGGGMAKGVNDMTHLVTDKVRRTVKFLCAVARGVPIVTPDWLTKCGKAGSFLSPNGFLVKDVEQEKRFNFTLQEALRVASSQPLLQGYEIHVTPSVKPEPAQMKEIVACCGARFLPKMPSAHKAQTVVVSCEEDRALCERARTLSLPVVSAEFLLTGILQQRVDVQAHALSLSPTAAVSKPAARSRGK